MFLCLKRTETHTFAAHSLTPALSRPHVVLDLYVRTLLIWKTHRVTVYKMRADVGTADPMGNTFGGGGAWAQLRCQLTRRASLKRTTKKRLVCNRSFKSENHINQYNKLTNNI